MPNMNGAGASNIDGLMDVLAQLWQGLFILSASWHRPNLASRVMYPPTPHHYNRRVKVLFGLSRYILCNNMSRRSSRTPKKAPLSLPSGVTTGLDSLIDGNESTIASMLSVSVSKHQEADASSSIKTKLMEALTDCMAMNNLSAEALLARFFHVDLLRKYCEERLGQSGKGNEATLAARIARAWSKPNFQPLSLIDAPNNDDDDTSSNAADAAADSKKGGDKKGIDGSSSSSSSSGDKGATTKKRKRIAEPKSSSS